MVSCDFGTHAISDAASAGKLDSQGCEPRSATASGGSVVGQSDCGRIAGLKRDAMGAYLKDVRTATNLRSAEKSWAWLGDRYSVARWRNGSNQGFYYGTRRS